MGNRETVRFIGVFSVLTDGKRLGEPKHVAVHILALEGEKGGVHWSVCAKTCMCAQRKQEGQTVAIRPTVTRRLRVARRPTVTKSTEAHGPTVTRSKQVNGNKEANGNNRAGASQPHSHRHAHLAPRSSHTLREHLALSPR